MGCSGSVSGTKVATSKGNPKTASDDTIYSFVDVQSLQLPFAFLLRDCSSYLCTSPLVPSICLTQQAFPIITASLPFDETGQSFIELPVVSAAFYGSGRVICFPHGSIVYDIQDHGQTAVFFNHALSWIAHQNTTMTPILLLGFSPDLSSQATSILHSYGFFVEVCNKIQKINTYRIILVPSSFVCPSDENYSKLVQFVENGGGLAVFYLPSAEDEETMTLNFPINRLLSKFGLSYTFCSITANGEPISIEKNFQVVYPHHFEKIAHKVINQLKSPIDEIQETKLDNQVTTLRYNIIVCDEQEYDQMLEIYTACLEFLKANEYFENQLFHPNNVQIIIILLLQDIIPRMPIDQILPAQGYEIFPGICDETQMSNFSLELDILDETWISTGLYLPAGIVAIVKTETAHPNLHIQVGAHHETLLQKPVPWKRLPSIITAYPLISTETKISSPFGGPVYITASEPLEETIRVKFEFHNFTLYPRRVKGDPSIWELTQDKKVPFGEVELDNIILTMPSDEIRNINFDLFSKVIDSLSSKVADFMCYPITRKFRIVFDIDLADSGASFGYPIVLLINEIPAMFHDLTKPSMPLFTLCNLMGIVTIPEGCFDSTIEAALAAVAASVAFKQVFGEFDPKELASKTLPPLFNELWEITQAYPDIIPATLKKFQDPEYVIVGVPEDAWIEFVREMCRIGERDFTKLLEQSRAIPLSVSMSCHSFQPFIPDELKNPPEESSPLCS